MNMIETINRCAGYGRISDDQEMNEHRALRQFQFAVAQFRSQLQDIACLTTVMHDEISDLIKAVDDDAPSARVWAERIEAVS